MYCERTGVVVGIRFPRPSYLERFISDYFLPHNYSVFYLVHRSARPEQEFFGQDGDLVLEIAREFDVVCEKDMLVGGSIKQALGDKMLSTFPRAYSWEEYIKSIVGKNPHMENLRADFDKWLREFSSGRLSSSGS